ncbi:MAG: heme A synthase [Balneolaceae bacterium]|nr:heme A synthase [Balneolaceae bacterium]
MNLNTFQKTAIATVIATLFLIFVGGLVRAAGAGLGCPDWPTCFGLWIPPTSVADLPAGFDASQFNVYKTWIEYLNRLVGVVIGLLIIATFAFSFRYRSDKPSVFYSSGAALVLVLIQGWLGGQVVKSGLNEWMITIHMILALIIVNTLLYASFKATTGMISIKVGEKLRKQLLWVTGIVLALTLVQLVLGTQVREAVDVIKNGAYVPPRSSWVEMLMDGIFPVHRSFSWALLLAAGWMYYILRKEYAGGWVLWLGQAVIALVLVQLGTGIGLAYLDMPRVLQVLHLLGVALMVCGQFLLILVLTITAISGKTKRA